MRRWPAVSPSGFGENLADFDRRASPVGSCSPGRNPVDSSEEGAPFRELIRPSVLGEPLVDSLKEPMPVEKQLEYAIQATVWEPLEQVHYVVSGYVNFDSFGMGRWWDTQRWLPALWDFLEDDVSVSMVDSAVMPTSDCEWT